MGKILHDSPLANHDYGFALYDPESAEWIAQRQANRYFTPASNTKILTLATALHFLGDSSIAARYVVKGDTLYFWGTGDPSLLYEDFEGDQLIQLIQSYEGDAVVYVPLEPVDKFGAGWAWDDYRYSYQVERSTLPIYGNRITVKREGNRTLFVPEYFRQYTVEDRSERRGFSRSGEGNSFVINPNVVRRRDFERTAPFAVTDYDIAQLLTEAAERDVLLNYSFKHPEQSQELTGVKMDSLYKQLMQISDNFIAEQLLLMCSDAHLGKMDAEEIMDLAQEEVFASLPDSMIWYDGSGLSRYNMYTPQSLVKLLEQIYTKQGMDYIREIFPAGGESGTIEDWYVGEDGPYVYAKTGTLRSTHCLSGFIETKSGKTLIFSMMNGHYLGSSSTIKPAMQHILKEIHDNF